MISRDDQEIILAQAVQKIRNSRIKGFERRCIACHISAMAVQRVEIDEIGEQHPALRERGQPIKRGIEQRLVAIAAQVSG